MASPTCGQMYDGDFFDGTNSHLMQLYDTGMTSMCAQACILFLHVAYVTSSASHSKWECCPYWGRTVMGLMCCEWVRPNWKQREIHRLVNVPLACRLPGFASVIVWLSRVNTARTRLQ